VERIKNTIKNKEMWASIVNAITVMAFVLGILALLTLVYYFVRPIRTADIKVPVATDQATYAAGDPIAGIFFGEIFYDGEVRVLREVFCSNNYKRILSVPPEAEVDKDFYSSQSVARVIVGLQVPIGNLPNDIPVSSNCVIKFTNVYRIVTPFGIRRLEYNYYTQNFSIVSDDRRQQLDCEATGTETCDFIGEEQKNEPDKSDSTSSSTNTPSQSAPASPQPKQNSVSNDNSTTNNTRNNNQTTEPVQPEERCTVDFIIKIGCR